MLETLAALLGFSRELNEDFRIQHNHHEDTTDVMTIDDSFRMRKTSFDGSFMDELGGKLYLLDGSDIFCCAMCHTHLASKDMIVSKAFQGRGGRAYLFESCLNYKLGNEEERMLMTGRHVVCDVSCSICHALLGWNYKKAYEPSQKYKEGKFILEMKSVLLDC